MVKSSEFTESHTGGFRRLQLNLCPVQPSPPKTRQNSRLFISIKGLERIDWHFKDSPTMRKSKNYADSGSNQSVKVYNHLSSFMLERRTHYLKCLNWHWQIGFFSDSICFVFFGRHPSWCFLCSSRLSHHWRIAQDSIAGAKFFLKIFSETEKKKRRNRPYVSNLNSSNLELVQLYRWKKAQQLNFGIWFLVTFPFFFLKIHYWF